MRKYIERGVEVPAYGPRVVGRPSKIAPYIGFLRERVTAFPDLTASRLTREIREMGYVGAYTAVKRYLAAIRPEHDLKPYEVRFETKAGVQGQVDFARFVVEFTDEPGVARIVWLFSMVLGYSRFLFARYVLHQDLQTLLRCHMQAFEALDGVPIEILYDRMKTAVTGEDDQGHIVYNTSLLALAKHYPPVISGALARLARARVQSKVADQLGWIVKAPHIADGGRDAGCDGHIDAGQCHQASDGRVSHSHFGNIGLYVLEGPFDEINLGQVPLNGSPFIIRKSLGSNPLPPAYAGQVAVRARRDQMGMQDRLDEVLQPYSLADQLGASGHLSSKGECCFVGNPDFRQEARCIEFGQHRSIDRIGLDLGMRDQSHLLRVGDDDAIEVGGKDLDHRCGVASRLDDHVIVMRELRPGELFQALA